MSVNVILEYKFWSLLSADDEITVSSLYLYPLINKYIYRFIPLSLSGIYRGGGLLINYILLAAEKMGNLI